MNGHDVRELEIELLERELARLRRSLTFLEGEIQECAAEIRAARAVVPRQAPSGESRATSGAAHSAWFDKLADDAFLRMADLVRTPSRPGAEVLLPFSSSTLWNMVSKNRFPKPVKLGNRITAWRVRDVRDWLRNPRN